MSYQDAIDKAEHLLAVGQDLVFLDREDTPPWDKADSVEKGCGYRLDIPTGCYVIAHAAGLTFKWSIEFEKRDANGRGISVFDRDRMREVAMKMPPKVRQQFADLLAQEILPNMEKRTREIRDAINEQLDTEDCVRGLIAFASES